MVIPISNAIQPQAAAQTAAARPLAPQPKPQSSPTPADTVQISAAAKAVQEILETQAQTAKEAAGGDSQARRLLAKEAAEKAHG